MIMVAVYVMEIWAKSIIICTQGKYGHQGQHVLQDMRLFPTLPYALVIPIIY